VRRSQEKQLTCLVYMKQINYLFITGSDINDHTIMSSSHRHPCHEFTKAVTHCHKKYGKQGEECVREELSQKKCFAQLLCRNEARRFYDEKSVPRNNINDKWQSISILKSSFVSNQNQRSFNDTDEELKGNDYDVMVLPGKVSCATLVEIFAKPENELLIPEGIKKDDRIYCRKITHELAACLSKKRRS